MHSTGKRNRIGVWHRCFFIAVGVKALYVFKNDKTASFCQFFTNRCSKCICKTQRCPMEYSTTYRLVVGLHRHNSFLAKIWTVYTTTILQQSRKCVSVIESFLVLFFFSRFNPVCGSWAKCVTHRFKSGSGLNANNSLYMSLRSW